ncbi:MAG: FtsW/RodA/SpoVE family cell cycle protein, partial [Azonexus sp.]|nr:FtsW/RodA/SpoVE family cell cycle protein [Azonexus sp.]
MIDIPGTLRRGWQQLIAHIDFPLFLITVAIMAVGLATVYSATFDGNERILSQAGNKGIALVVMWFVSRIPPQKLMSFAIPLYLLGLALLIAVFAFGITVNGAKRWLSLGFTRIQPSEMMKITMPLMLAWYFQKYEASLNMKHFIVAGLLL